MIVQRYNTFTTYWQRISRQIEQGTYKRDVMRAQARFGVDLKRERLTAQAPPEPDRHPSSAPAIALPEQPIEEVYELEAVPDEGPSLEDDLLADIQRQPPRAAPAERFVSAAKLELDEFSDPFEELDPFPKPRAPPAPRGPVVTRMSPDASRDTDRRIPVAVPTTAPRAPVAAPPPARSLRPEPRVIVAKRASIPDPLEAAPAPPPPPSVRNVSPAMASAPRVQLRGPAPAGPQQASPGGRPAPVAAVNTAAPRPAPSAAPPPTRPIAPAPAPARPAPPPPAPAPPARIGDLTRDRFGQIYSQYVETRRRQNEPTGAITRDALAKQLDESTSRLKQKHGAKAIDFEVVVKDGRTILRPVVK
jgi:hypothetical protein